MNTFEKERTLSNEFKTTTLTEVTNRIIRGEEISVRFLEDKYFSEKPTNLRYLDLRKIEDGIIHYDDLRSLKSTFIDFLNNLYPDKPVIEYGEQYEFVIISRSAPFKVAYYDNDTSRYPELIASNNMYFIIPEGINALYLAAFLDSDAGSKALDDCKTGRSIKTLSLKKFRLMEIPRFSEEKELQIARKYKNYLDEMRKAKQHYKDVKELKNKLFNKKSK